ncbi:MAG: outer membrane lipoprotein-sorting protein [Desulfatiglans sp.]|nr:outer membrane lipoprotein-sorting protein [Thermodesulfobacteriota bacterium]MEE4354753.1 outer membrane lipoprotein-sorting protein [Desulfatiglans sp.]
MMKKLFLLVITGTMILQAAAVFGAERPSPDKIIEMANDASYYQGQDGRADVKMTITDKAGGVRIREFTILRKNTGQKDQKFYVYFKEPADVRKMAYLVWKHVGKEDSRWLWLPALNLKKRIAPGDKRTSFVGSDFFYEDVSGRGVNEDTHELLKSDDTWYLIKNVPKDPDSVEFVYYHVWINKTTFLPEKAEYYDKNGNLYRRVEAKKIMKIQGYPTVVESIASDLVAGTRTINRFDNVRYDIGLKDRIFTERFLRRPPREVTQ